MRDLNQTLKELKNEDIIWIISIFTAFFALISNSIERKYTDQKVPKFKKDFKTINIFIGVVSFFVYLYFLVLTYSRFKENNPNTSFKTMRIRQANFIAASLVIIASVIYLITEILSDDDTDIDLLI